LIQELIDNNGILKEDDKINDKSYL